MVRKKSALIGLIALCATLVGVVGCGSSGESDGTTSIFMVSAPPGDDFYYTIEQSAKREAEKRGVDLEIQQFGKWEPAAQTSVFNAGVAKNPDAILVNPVDTESLQAPLEKAAERGIEIITYDTTTGEPEGVVSTFVASDVEELGRRAGNALVDLMGTEGKIYYQQTEPDQSFFESLHQGWTEVVDEYPGLEQLPVVYSDWEPSKAHSQMEAALTAHPDLKGGFAGIYVDQQGAVPALERAGKIGEVTLIGVDGAPPNIERLRSGALAALVSVKAANYGIAAIDAALKAIDGETLPPETMIGQCLITADTIDDPKNADCLYEKAQ
ncbi:MAG TPA: substrate-binding domain-containing protein [Solirubrobacterales bacterium]|nr:substrate-binding domain-containing protein [Solirubrobacterales bacterium]